mgnify:CR=1 FL=1
MKKVNDTNSDKESNDDCEVQTSTSVTIPSNTVISGNTKNSPNRNDLSNTRQGVHCNSTSLCETLGSVRFILNDKTGTLTRNELILRELWVNQQCIQIKPIVSQSYQFSPATIHPDFDTSNYSTQFELFQQCILLCNSCFILNHSIKSDNPDETALLIGCTQLGSYILYRDDHKVSVRVCEKEEDTWSILQLNSFTSERKRMSIVVKNVKNGSIFVFLKEGLFLLFYG